MAKQHGRGTDSAIRLRLQELRNRIASLIAKTDDLGTILSGVATEATQLDVLSAIDSMRDYEVRLVVDSLDVTWLEVRYWDTQDGTLGAPLYYPPGSSTAGTPTGALTYINPNTYLAQLVSNTTGLNLEATQLLVKGVLDTIKTDTANLDVALSTRATEATLLATNSLLTTIDGVLDTIKTDTANLDVALSTRATEATLLATNSLLTTIDGVLDTIKTDTANLDVALSTRSSESTLLATNALLTTIDGVLDDIKLDTANLALGTSGDTTSVAASATVVTLKASNTSRKSLKIVNDGTKVLYVREGAGATTSLYTWKLEQDEMAIINDYNGIVTGIWDVANGSAKVTETT